MIRVGLAMSGGVDSSVAVHLLQKAGYEVVGLTMRTDESLAACEDAKKVADAFGIEHHALDLRDAFHQHVTTPFAEAYRQGRTPNPCIPCNEFLKFGLLYEKARELGCDKYATGHYASIVQTAGGDYTFGPAKDTKKDQSYMLWRLKKEIFPHLLMPLGDMTKPEIRAIAAELDLFVKDKGDSQDICFIPDGDYRAYLADRIETRPGSFVDRDGKLLGRHTGTPHYTVGQRRGLGIAAKEPYYVTGVFPERNEVRLGFRDELYADGLLAENANFILEPENGPLEVKIRYSQTTLTCELADRTDNGFTLRFHEKARAVSPGQSAVLYQNGLLVGGGFIKKAL